MEQNIKPIWVFDGKPPDIKHEELEHREKLKEKAKKAKEIAEDEGDAEEEVKQAKRSIKVTQNMVDDAKNLLKILGLPVVQAKSEAEAQCALLNKQGIAYAVASEDLDSLTYGTKVLLRKCKNNKKPVIHIELSQVLQDLELDYNQFVDFCILCGSDYTQPIKGVGTVNALRLMQKHGSLEAALDEIRTTTTKSTGKLKYKIPEQYNYKQAKETFTNPEVYDVESLNVHELD